MSVLRPFSTRFVQSAVAGQCFFAGQVIWHRRPEALRREARLPASRPLSHSTRSLDGSTQSTRSPSDSSTQSTRASSDGSAPTQAKSSSSKTAQDGAKSGGSPADWEDWEDNVNHEISNFADLPHKEFGFNQHMIVNAEFKEALRQVLWQFRAPIRYAFAYGSGVFPQSSKTPAVLPESPHPHAPEAVVQWQKNGGKTIDFIFGVSHTEHWHSLNLAQHRNHYSFLGSLGSGIVSRVQDNIGAGAYFNPYVIVNGIMIKYGVINLDTIYRDVSQWDTMYIAGRLQKPVKILRDDPRIRLGNQVNLLSALRAALLMLPENFSERDLYTKIAGLSYMGDARMTFKAEDPKKVTNIVDAQMSNFRQLYYPLVNELPNVVFGGPETSDPTWMASSEANCKMKQDMDPVKRGNMVRRLPPIFQSRLYNSYRKIFDGSSEEFRAMLGKDKTEDPFSVRLAGDFDKKIASRDDLADQVAVVVKRTVAWPTVTQSLKGMLTAGFSRGLQYLLEKRKKGRKRTQVAKKEKAEERAEQTKDSSK